MASTKQLWTRIVATVLVLGAAVGYVVQNDGGRRRERAGFALVEPVGGPSWGR